MRTLWGELAWQLGYASGGASEARKAYERVRPDDEQATNPGGCPTRTAERLWSLPDTD